MVALNQSPRTLDVELPLTTFLNDYTVQLKIKEHTVSLSLDLSGGSKEAQSDLVSVGTFNGVPIMAQINFQYDYDADENELTIHGNDDQTEDQLRISAFLQDVPGQMLAQRVELSARPNGVDTNQPVTKLWADYVARNTVLHQQLMTIARRCNEILVDAAIEAGIDRVVQLGTAPVVTLDNLDEFKRMYGRPVAAEPPADRTAELAEIQELVRSTYVGTVTWADNYDFANVRGSTHDPKVDGLSWIRLWEEKCNGKVTPGHCTSHNWFSNDHTRPCNGDLIGGHVITGQASSREHKGATVYIFPICTRHNANNNSYMHVVYNNKGVQLKYWE